MDSRTFALGHANLLSRASAQPRAGSWRNSTPPPPKPREGPSALARQRSEPVWLGVRNHTHALFALKVQRKLSNGVAGFAAAGSSLDRQKIAGNPRAISAMQIDDQ